MKDINEIIKMYNDLLVDEIDDEQIKNYTENIDLLERKKLEKR